MTSCAAVTSSPDEPLCQNANDRTGRQTGYFQASFQQLHTASRTQLQTNEQKGSELVELLAKHPTAPDAGEAALMTACPIWPHYAPQQCNSLPLLPVQQDIEQSELFLSATKLPLG
eukprot:4453495-Amphidinium_carterae.1